MDQTRLRFAVARIVEGLLAILEIRAAPASVPPRAEREQIPSLDPVRLQHLREWRAAGQPDVLPEVIDAFVSESLALIESLHLAAAAGQGDAMGRAADALYWASRNVGATRMALLSAELRESATHGPGERVDALVGETAAEFDRIRSLLAEGRG